MWQLRPMVKRTGLVMGLAWLLTGAQVRAETLEGNAGADGARSEDVPVVVPPTLEEDGSTRPVRFSLGVLGGAVGGAAVAVGTVLVFCSAEPNDGWCVLPGALLGTMLAATVGIPLGAWGMGHLLDGDGSFLAALAGTLAGSLAFYGVWSVMNATGGGISTAETWLGYAALTLPPIGAALGYELTSSHSRKAAAEGRRLSLAPAVMPGGGGLALVGAF